jgi:hypothetical protein
MEPKSGTNITNNKKNVFIKGFLNFDLMTSKKDQNQRINKNIPKLIDK